MIRSVTNSIVKHGSSVCSVTCSRSLYNFSCHNKKWTVNSSCARTLKSAPILKTEGVQSHFHTGNPRKGILNPRDDTTVWGRALKRIGFLEIPQAILKQSGYRLYVKVADEIDYMKFFTNCHLPDTYASWYAVVELHVWLLSARLMQDGDEGKLVRNVVINAFFDDNQEKSKKLEGALVSARREEIKILGQQFYAALLSYDEGLLSDDYVLAGALWRRFLRKDADVSKINIQIDAAKQEELLKQMKAVEMLLIYVRSQFFMLNQLSREQLIRKRAVKWAPFDDTLFTLANKMEKMSSSSKKAEIKI